MATPWQGWAMLILPAKKTAYTPEMTEPTQPIIALRLAKNKFTAGILIN